jgi:hypothetical protein
MPLGIGYFYDRKRKKYILIEEHATDAITRPDTFGSHAVKHLNPVADRDTIVIHVLRNGFIRVRHWKDRLGWQFWGEPEKSLKTLKSYIKKNDIGEGSIVTFTDFQSGRNVECNVRDVLKKTFIKDFIEV